MKIPKTVTIIGHKIKVIFKDKVLLHEKEEAGVASFNDNKIYLATKADHGEIDISNSNLTEVFLHEAIHFIDTGLGLKMKERQVECLARGLLAFIRENNLDFRK